MTIRILTGDCRDVMATMELDSVDACVTDPPYGLGFMGKGWDRGVPGVEFWTAVFRVLKPGGHLLAFSGTRTQHRMVCAIEDAGFEIRDQIGWAYGSGFPKSLDVSKAIDKAAGAERGRNPDFRNGPNTNHATKGQPAIVGGYTGAAELDQGPATPEAAAWQGWGTALKPAWESVCVARKPLVGTVAANVLAHGTGALNIDGCRVDWASDTERAEVNQRSGPNARFNGELKRCNPPGGDLRMRAHAVDDKTHVSGRWPANLVHDGSDEVLACFPDSGGGAWPASGAGLGYKGGGGGYERGERVVTDTGSAARFFYTAKASRSERGDGNDHPTVKPVALMRWLVRLVTPPGGMVLDPFGGSGTTGIAANIEQMHATLIEMSPEYAAIAEARIRTEAGLFAEVAAE